MDFSKIKQALISLPDSATEPIVSSIFISELLTILGFDLIETVPQFTTGNGGNTVDYAVRKNSGSDIFINTKSNPYLLVEAKGKNINLSPNSAQYKATVNQLKNYLLAPNCKSGKFSPKKDILWQFDIITSDEKLQNLEEEKLRHMISPVRLRQALEPFNLRYDYILIDSPPNWRLFSQSAVCAADVVLIPTKHNSIFSLENAVTVIKRFVPEIQKGRKDGGPIALPIFFNGESITEAQRLSAEQAINEILAKGKKDKVNPIDLTPYFYPKSTSAREDHHIFGIPSFAHIAGGAFTRVPAAYKHKIACEYYLALVKEYFLQ
ncbi:AAA family ATPase [Nostoc flagelliforme FACHB-838]|uniref:AAA family ATPase n=1 Tax=Nostoc flagelliforme FACHB-838 TaxID=2692904 RepID=A0ABR8E2G9_9NOSO|nr:ParA family protein [Nostoc flagelliforme]MBD2535922.1 AAA family ATPase [Nostoc flagelliforme FACHB-838]